MMDPFTYIRIVPDYESGRMILEWDVSAEFAAGEFIVQKSNDGVANFTNISGKLQGNMRSFMDEQFPSLAYDIIPYYRVVIVLNKKKYNSSTITPYYQVTKREYGIARHIIRQERTRIAHVNGIQMILRKKLYNGERCVCVDSETGQSKGKSDCEICYGTGIVGGYQEPIVIRVELRDLQNVKKENSQGLGVDEVSQIQGITISYPRINYEDILINRQEGKVYIVSAVKHHLFKGVIPVNCFLTLTELPKKDIRYKLK